MRPAAYYNEIDPYAAQWLRNLIAAGHIAPGDVDERSIVEVKPDDLKNYTQCHFFAGIGVWSYALRHAGWPDDRPVWTGSCPCQPFSIAGKQTGQLDERHLAPTWLNLIQQCQPAIIFGEQVAPAIGKHWLDDLFDELESQKYACGASVFPACSVGAPHRRQRLWFVASRLANSNNKRLERRNDMPKCPTKLAAGQSCMANQPHPGAVNGFWSDADWLHCRDGKWRPVEPKSFPLADGTPSRVGRLRAYGNAINTEAAEAFISAYMDDYQ